MRSSPGPAVALLLVAGVAAADAPWPIVAWWPFDEAEGAVFADLGPNHLEGVLQPPGQIGRADGMRGKALSFPQGSEAWGEAPATDLLDLRPPFTIAAWIKPLAGGVAMEILCKKGDTEAQGYRLRYGWRMAVFEVGDGQETVRINSPPYSVEVGHWCHVAASHDGERIRLFLNAEPVAEREFSATPAPHPRRAVVGNYVGRKNAYPFYGLIDELVVVARALDGEELYRLASGAGAR